VSGDRLVRVGWVYPSGSAPGACPGGCPEVPSGACLAVPWNCAIPGYAGIRHFRGYLESAQLWLSRNPPKLGTRRMSWGCLGTGPPGALRMPIRDVSGTLSGSVPGAGLGTSWGRPWVCPEVPSGRSGSAFRTPKRPFPAPEGRKRPFRPVWAYPRDMHYR
jgi:hypothetical protein